MPGLSTQALQALSQMLIWVGALAGGIAVVAGLVSALAANRASDALQRDADRKIAEAHATATSAAAQGEQARVEAAQATERAAALEKEAAQARLETEQLRLHLAGRRLSQRQHDEIVEALRGHAFPVTIRWPAADTEAALFAKDIGDTLQDAGLTVNGAPWVGDSVELGLAISKMPRDDEPPSDDWVLLASAFKNVGWTFGLGAPKPELTISVGSKEAPWVDTRPLDRQHPTRERKRGPTPPS